MIVAYVRNSSRSQKDSIDSQKHSIYSSIPDEEQGKVELYADRDQSGSKDDRKQFQEVWDMIKNNKVEKLYVTEIQRISRTTSTLIEFMEDCFENETSIIVTDGEFPNVKDTPYMKILAQIFAIMSNLELEMNKARTRRGLNRAIEKGKWIGRPPKGFTTNENGYLVVKDDEYKLVSTAIDMILEDGESQYKVSRSTGINQSTLQNILDDEEKLSLYRQDKENAVKSLNNSRKD